MRALRLRGESFALAVVVLTEGSTYRKPGALVVVSDDGTRYGAISGGCLEQSLETSALQVLGTNTPSCVVFDTQSDDDAVFGSGSGCRGSMTVLLIPIDSNRPNALIDALQTADASHLVLRLALIMDGPHRGAGRCWYGFDEIGLAFDASDLGTFRDRPPGEYRLSLSAGDARLAVLDVPPSPRVLLIGAGPEVPPFIRLAQEMGWHTMVMDHRETTLEKHARLAEQSMLARPAAGLAQLAEHVFDACIVMTHTAANDLEAMISLAGRGEQYIGLLGPPARRDEILRQLDAASRESFAGRLHAPVGVPLGGNGPEAVALSIAAGLQQSFSRGR